MDTLTLEVKNLAAALKVTGDVVEVAEKVVREGLKPNGKGQKRKVRQCWETFCSFAQACGLPHEEALKAIEGNLDETYVSPAEISQRRIESASRIADKLRKELEKAHAYTQNVVDSLINEVGTIPVTPYKYSTSVEQDDTPTIGMVNCSDWHIGSAWPHSETGFGDMSTDILGARVELLSNKVVSLTRLQKRISPINRLVVNFLGDIAENDALHASSAIHVDNPTIRQLSSAINASERMLKTYLEEFQEVTVMAVYGNHGRMGAKGEQHALNNWDVLAYSFIAERFSDEPRLKFHISTTPYMAYILDDQPEWVHCIIHGDGIPAPFSLPLYSITRAEAQISKILDRPINYSHFAHWHNMAQMDKTFGAIFINGSLVGTSPHGVGLRLAGQAKQLYMGLHPELGQTWMYPIYLQSHKRAEPDMHGILTPHIESITQTTRIV